MKLKHMLVFILFFGTLFYLLYILIMTELYTTIIMKPIIESSFPNYFVDNLSVCQNKCNNLMKSCVEVCKTTGKSDEICQKRICNDEINICKDSCKNHILNLEQCKAVCDKDKKCTDILYEPLNSKIGICTKQNINKINEIDYVIIPKNNKLELEKIKKSMESNKMKYQNLTNCLDKTKKDSTVIFQPASYEIDSYKLENGVFKPNDLTKDYQTVSLTARRCIEVPDNKNLMYTIIQNNLQRSTLKK